MPFKSESQRKYLYANEPAVARRWTKKYGSKVGGKKKKWKPSNSKSVRARAVAKLRAKRKKMK